MIGWKCFVPVRYQLPKGSVAGLALTYFYMMHRVGRRLLVGTDKSNYLDHFAK